MTGNLDAVGLLHRMLEIDSPSGNEGELACFLKRTMSSLGIDASIDRAGNVIGAKTGGTRADGGLQKIMLVGHMDVVQGRVPVRRDGDRLFGRGAVDAKGPLAAFVAAVALSDPPPGVSVEVVGAVEEESAASRGARHLAACPAPDACIIGEPSGWDGITLGYKGRLLIDYHDHQPSGHSAGPEPCVIEAAVEWWNALLAFSREFNSSRTGIFQQLTPGLRTMNSSSDGLQDSVEVTVGFRLPPGFDSEQLRRAATTLANRASLRFYGSEEAFVAGKSNPLVRGLMAGIRGLGGRPRFKMKSGTSDMNVVGPAWKCPIAAYGPGDSRLDHRPDEHILISEFLKGVEVLRHSITRWGP